MFTHRNCSDKGKKLKNFLNIHLDFVNYNYNNYLLLFKENVNY